MFSFISNWYEKGKNKLFDKGKTYALKKLVKSDYLKETTSIIPLTLVSVITKNIFNFLVTYRIRTDIYPLDFLISILVTVGFSLSSPFFYNLTNHFIGPDIDNFSKYCIDSFWKEGWVFFEYWKTRILGTIGVMGIVFLYFVEIDSRYCQETIIHLMITSTIVDAINNRKWEFITVNLNEDVKENGDIPLVNMRNDYFILESYRGMHDEEAEKGVYAEESNNLEGEKEEKKKIEGERKDLEEERKILEWESKDLEWESKDLQGEKRERKILEGESKKIEGESEDSWDNCEPLDMSEVMKYIERGERSFVRKKRNLVSRSLNLLKNSLGYSKENNKGNNKENNGNDREKNRDIENSGKYGNKIYGEESITKTSDFEIKEDYEN